MAAIEEYKAMATNTTKPLKSFESVVKDLFIRHGISETPVIRQYLDIAGALLSFGAERVGRYTDESKYGRALKASAGAALGVSATFVRKGTVIDFAFTIF